MRSRYSSKKSATVRAIPAFQPTVQSPIRSRRTPWSKMAVSRL